MTTALLLGLTLIVMLPVVLFLGSYGVSGTVKRLNVLLLAFADSYEFWTLQRRELRRFWRHRRAEYEAALVPRPDEVQTVLEIR